MVNCEGCIHKDLCKANGVKDEYVADSCSFYEKKKEKKWTPISEGVPSEYCRCWITTVDGRVSADYFTGGGFALTSKDRIVAWMPSDEEPEPYGTEISDEEAIDILKEVKELAVCLNQKYEKALDIAIKSLKEQEFARKVKENGYMTIWTKDVSK